MFRLTTARRTASILFTTTLLAASGASAQGVSVERGLNEDTGNYEMTRSRSGTNGSVTTERACGEGEVQNAVQGCVRVKTVTTADGQSYTKETAVIQGPVRTRAVGRTTNADGEQRKFLRRFRN